MQTNEVLPRITVVTPSFNQGDYIEKTIQSVLAQNYPNLEYLVIDGGSKDQTVDIIKKYEKHLAYWESAPDRGQSHAINKGLSRATGEILTWLNSDDCYTPGALRKFAEMFLQNPGAGVAVGAGRKIDQHGNVVYTKEPTNPIDLQSMYGWLRGGNFMQPSSAFSREAWNQCGPLDENEHIALDLDFWLRVAVKGFQFISTGETLSDALSHSEAKTTAYIGRMKAEAMLVIMKHGGIQALDADLRKLGKDLDNMANRLAWYEENYQAVINHPIIKLIHPVIKRLSGKGGYWQQQIPPWVKS